MKKLIVSVLLLLGATLIFSQGNKENDDSNAGSNKIEIENVDSKLS
jgi:hypothetical protein